MSPVFIVHASMPKYSIDSMLHFMRLALSYRLKSLLGNNLFIFIDPLLPFWIPIFISRVIKFIIIFIANSTQITVFFPFLIFWFRTYRLSVFCYVFMININFVWLIFSDKTSSSSLTYITLLTRLCNSHKVWAIRIVIRIT